MEAHFGGELQDDALIHVDDSDIDDGKSSEHDGYYNGTRAQKYHFEDDSLSDECTDNPVDNPLESDISVSDSDWSEGEILQEELLCEEETEKRFSCFSEMSRAEIYLVTVTLAFSAFMYWSGRW